MKYILDHRDKLDLARFGGKAAALRQLADSKLSVPAWFVIDPAAFYASIAAQRLGWPPSDDGAEQISKNLTDLQPCPELLTELKEALTKLASNNERLAVRSSAVDEDSAEHSFAGQLESYLYIPPEEVAARILDVWRSGFTERVITYRREAGLADPPAAPAVLVQRMLASEAAGVAFAVDPVSGKRNHCVVSAVHGPGSVLVSGEAEADTWRINAENRIVDYQAPSERLAHRYDEKTENHARIETVTNHGPPLTNEQVLRVADLTRRASAWFGRYQDIEWAFEQGQLYILQSRPITALRDLPDPDGERNLWDNSNIAESYGGITTPLTFSFARSVYESVYREFCRILKVPTAIIEANDTVFKRMLGLIRGRVYYNLLSWYRVLAMLPGFTVNRRFMEQMMGVKEGLPDEIVAELEQNGAPSRLRDSLRLAGTSAGLIANHFLLPRKIKSFYKRLDRALQLETELDDLEATRLCRHYHDLERRLLTHWDAPLINDFFAMIFHGVLRKLSLSWCDDQNETLHNDLLVGEGGMISAEPAKRVRRLAELALGDAELIDTLCNADRDVLASKLPQRPAFAEAFQAYLDKFGDRCLDELKLESQTLHDDPLPLLRSIGALAQRLGNNEPARPDNIEAKIRTAAEARAAAALQNNLPRRLVFNWVLKHARARVRERENLRFERTRLFGRIRRIFIALGWRLAAHGLLAEPRDVFYLEVEEVMGFVEGTTVTTDLTGLVALRRREFQRYEQLQPPADRFETRGMTHQGNNFQAPSREAEPGEGDLKGMGCCPGLVRGPVRVVLDPRNVQLRAGEILVAERTDPGWIMLFPASAGILVERGSLLSHSAIVAREMGIPAIVSVPGVTRALKDGDWVEFDGGSGVIRRLATPEDTGDE